MRDRPLTFSRRFVSSLTPKRRIKAPRSKISDLIKRRANACALPFTLPFTLSVGLAGCGALGPQVGVPSAPQWARSSDQELIERARFVQGGLWAIAQGQLLVWEEGTGRLHRASTSAPTTEVYDVWVERLGVKRLNQRREARYAELLKAQAERAAQAAQASQASKGGEGELVIDLEGLEIEGLEIEGVDEGLEIEGEEPSAAPKSSPQGEEVELELDDVVIDTSEPAPPPKKSAPKPPPPLPSVKHRYRVYLATKQGLYQREVWLDEQWRDLLGDQAWSLLKAGETHTLRARAEGGAWWAGPSGFGWLERGKVGGSFGRVKAKLAVGRVGGGAWVVIDEPNSSKSPREALLQVGPELWQGGGEPIDLEAPPVAELLKEMGPLASGETSPCPQSALLDLNAMSVDGAKVDVALCASSSASDSASDSAGVSIALFKEGRWWRFEGLQGVVEPPRATRTGEGALWPWGEGLLYTSEGLAWRLREGTPTLTLSAQAQEAPQRVASALRFVSRGPKLAVSTPSSPAIQVVSVGAQEAPSALTPPKLYVSPFELKDLSPWVAESALVGSRAVKGGAPILAWSLPYQGLVVRSSEGGEVRQRLQSESFAALNETRPYSLDPQGALWVPQAKGASVFKDGQWRFVEAPSEGGRAMGVAHCPEGPLFVMSRRPTQERGGGEAKAGDPKLLVELWAPNAQAPVASIDWSDASFRYGEPKLGDVVCDAQGAVSGALFWGPGWVGSGVGLLHLPASRTKAEVWAHRQGYDGEEELSETPILPDFTINALAAAPNGALYLATNSGLVAVSAPAPSSSPNASGERKVRVLSEATGWLTDFINDVALGADGRLWLATDRGLYVTGPDLKPTLTTPRASMSAVGVDPNTGLIWVAIQDKLYRGDGDLQTWERVQLGEAGLLGTIKRVLPFDRVSASEGERSLSLVWLATTRGLLLGGR